MHKEFPDLDPNLDIETLYQRERSLVISKYIDERPDVGYLRRFISQHLVLSTSNGVY